MTIEPSGDTALRGEGDTDRHRTEPRVPLTSLCASGLRQSISWFCVPAGLVILPEYRPTSHP